MNSDDASEPGELTMVMSDLYGGTESEELLVLRSPSAMEKFFMNINKTRKPGLKPPVVDFTKNMVIAYCSGQTVQQDLPALVVAEDPEQGMMVRVKQKEGVENEESTAILRPFGLYLIPVTDKKISLESVQ